MRRRFEDFGRPERPATRLLPLVLGVGTLIASVLLVGGPGLLALTRYFGA